MVIRSNPGRSLHRMLAVQVIDIDVGDGMWEMTQGLSGRSFLTAVKDISVTKLSRH